MKEIVGASPWFGNSLDAILEDMKEVLVSGNLVKGKHLTKFEAGAALMSDSKYAVGVNSGGTALELALLALDVRGKEVIVPTQTFIASANAITRAGGYPVFVDIDKDTLCLNPKDFVAKIGSNTAGVMFVHMFGLIPPSILEIKKVCKEKGLFLIEDASHAHGASVEGVKAGNIGDVGCFSFFATKVITSGEGGIITTSREDIYEKVISLRDHGRVKNSALFDIPGNNFRLPELECILGWRQLELLNEILVHRNKIASIYREGFEDSPHVESLPNPEGSFRHSYWRYPAYLSEKIDRVEFQKRMWENHAIRITWMYEPLCHQQPVSHNYLYREYSDFSVAEWTIQRLINLPTHMEVTEEDAKRVVASVIKESENLV